MTERREGETLPTTVGGLLREDSWTPCILRLLTVLAKFLHFRCCFPNTVAEELAESTIQEFAIDALEHRLEEQESIWRALLRVSDRLIKRHKRRLDKVVNQDFSEEIDRYPDDPLETAERRELVSLARHAISQLSDSNREVLLLRNAGLTFKEIGELVGATPNTTRQRYLRARNAVASAVTPKEVGKC